MRSPSCLSRVFPWRSDFLARNSVLSEFTLTSEFSLGVDPIHNHTVQHRTEQMEQTRPKAATSYTSPHANFTYGTPDPSPLRGCSWGFGLSHSVGPDPWVQGRLDELAPKKRIFGGPIAKNDNGGASKGVPRRASFHVEYEAVNGRRAWWPESPFGRSVHAFPHHAAIPHLNGLARHG